MSDHQEILEQAAAWGPQIPFTTLQSRQIAQYTFAFLPVGLALNPRAHRIAVLARRQSHRDQYVGL